MKMKCNDSLSLILLSTSFIVGADAFLGRTYTQVTRTHHFSSLSTVATYCSSDSDKSHIEENNMAATTIDVMFGRFKILANQIFYRSNHSFAMVNLRPLVPGHVLVVSNRIVPLLSDLCDYEYEDLWKTVRKVQHVLKQEYSCDAFNVAVQDGEGAGQSVPHVHVHILPRYRGDMERNDDIYDKLEMWAPRKEYSQTKTCLEVPDDNERRDRTIDEMAEEAGLYQSLMKQQSEL